MKQPKPVLSLDFPIGEFNAEDMLMSLITECIKRGYMVAGIIMEPEHTLEPKIFGSGTIETVRTVMEVGTRILKDPIILEHKEVKGVVN